MGLTHLLREKEFQFGYQNKTPSYCLERDDKNKAFQKQQWSAKYSSWTKHGPAPVFVHLINYSLYFKITAKTQKIDMS